MPFVQALLRTVLSRLVPPAAPLLIGLCLIPCALSLAAQTTAGTITGSVADTSGRVIAGASVAVIENATGTRHPSRTNDQGIYTVPQLTTGDYTITVSKPGFSTATRANVYLQINQTASINITLAAGSVEQTVEVTGSAPLLQTQDVSLGTVVEEKQVEDLPLNGRQFSQLIELAPGVVPLSVGQSLAPGIGGGSVAPGINGQSNRSNLTFIDGIVTTDNLFSGYSISPSIDVIQTFQVESHATDAEFGEATGGTINIATKAGTNQFHGSGYEFFRNQDLNAIPYFSTSKSAFSLNDFGGTFGGPILKDKLFVFGFYEGVRQTVPNNNYSIVPTAAELSGNFGADGPIYDPATYNSTTQTAQQFQGNQINPSRFNQGILAVIKAYVPAPLTNVNIPAPYNYVNTTASTTNQNQWGVRGDYVLNAKNLFYARFIKNSEMSVSPGGLPDNNFVSNYNDKNLAVNYVRSQSETLTLALTGGLNFFNYPLYEQQPNAQAVFDAAGFAAGFTSTPGDIGAPYIPSIGLSSGYFGVSSGWGGQGQNQQTLYQLSGVAAKQLGRHALKFGVADHRSAEVGNYANDSEYYNQQATQNPCGSVVMGSCQGTGGNALASLLLGLPVYASRQLGSSLISIHNNIYGIYGQDSWKVSRKFNLSYGVRWDLTTSPVDNQNRFSGFDPTHNTWFIAKGNVATPSVLPAGVSISSSREIIRQNYKNFSPRVGINYLLTPKTSLVAGSGVFFDNWAGIIQAAQNSRGSWPNGGNQSVSNTNVAGITPGATAQNPFGNLQPIVAATPFPSSGTFVAPNFRNAYSWQWNIQVQQQLSNTAVLSVAYVGSSTSRAPLTRPANTNITLGPTLNIPFPQMQQFSLLESSGHLKYNAMQAKYEQRYAAGFTVTGAFTWSHAIDVGCSDIFVNCNIQNARNLKQEEADSAIDVPIILTTSVLYEFPFGKGKRFLSQGVGSALLGGWQINGLVIARQGTPFTPSINFDNANANGGSQRPNVTGNPEAGAHTLKHFFNTAAYSLPAPYTFGNAGRNSLRGPRYTDFDISLFRSIRIVRQQRLELRVEAFNALNHPQFGGPDATLEDADFGEILSSGSPRQIQLAAKYIF